MKHDGADRIKQAYTLPVEAADDLARLSTEFDMAPDDVIWLALMMLRDARDNTTDNRAIVVQPGIQQINATTVFGETGFRIGNLGPPDDANWRQISVPAARQLRRPSIRLRLVPALHDDQPTEVVAKVPENTDEPWGPATYTEHKKVRGLMHGVLVYMRLKHSLDDGHKP